MKGATFSNPISIIMFCYPNNKMIFNFTIDEIIEYIKNYFEFTDNQIYKIKENIRVIVANIDDNLKLMKKVMKHCGYQLCNSQYIYDTKFITLEFQSINNYENNNTH